VALQDTGPPAAADLDALLRTVAQRIEADVDELIETMLSRMRAEVPDYDAASRPELHEAERASIVGNLRAALRALAGHRQDPVGTPLEAVEAARVTAREGVPLEALLHVYRVGHAVAWERMLDVVEGMRLDSQARHAVLTIGSRFTFSYVDSVAKVVTEAYTQERDRLMRSSIQRRVQLVRDLLAGATVSGRDLGYDLDAEHLAVVTQGADAEPFLQELGRCMQRQLLTVAVSDQVTWAWLGSQKRIAPSDWRQLTGVLPADGTRAALGEPAWGPDGFRRSHSEALAARRVGERLAKPLTRYDDVALEAVLLADEQAARRLIQRELGPLVTDDERSIKLRNTLEAYLRTGHNASAAAATLGVNDRTIAYRVRTIEQLLGRSILERSTELAAALRLNRLKPPGEAPDRSVS
jgi:GGDEF-like domain/PucR C-terminal helix-turn-helix domain